MNRHTSDTVLGVWEAYSGLTRGELAQATLQQLLHGGLYRGEEGVKEEILFSEQFSDIVTIRRRSEVRNEQTSPLNLRQPFLLVSRADDFLVSLSANLNCGAVDNKVTATLCGRTGAFCTACKAPAEAMVGVTPSHVFHMDLDIKEAQGKFLELFRKAFGDTEEAEASSATLPSARGDYATRHGQKHAPVTVEWDSTKV